MKKILTLTFTLLFALSATAQSTFTSTLTAKAAKGATIYGTVECNGTPLEGVVVSDGVEVVKTDKRVSITSPPTRKPDMYLSLYQVDTRQ